MISRNDITGDAIQTKKISDAYRDGWDRIFKQREISTSEEHRPQQEKNKDDSIEDKRCNA